MIVDMIEAVSDSAPFRENGMTGPVEEKNEGLQ